MKDYMFTTSLNGMDSDFDLNLLLHKIKSQIDRHVNLFHKSEKEAISHIVSKQFSFWDTDKLITVLLKNRGLERLKVSSKPANFKELLQDTFRRLLLECLTHDCEVDYVLNELREHYELSILIDVPQDVQLTETTNKELKQFVKHVSEESMFSKIQLAGNDIDTKIIRNSSVDSHLCEVIVLKSVPKFIERNKDKRLLQEIYKTKGSNKPRANITVYNGNDFRRSIDIDSFHMPFESKTKSICINP